MKTNRLILIMLAGICLLTTCENEDEIFPEDLTAENLKCTDHHGYHHGLNQERLVTMRSTGLIVHYRIIDKGLVDIVFIPGWTKPLTAYTKQFDYFTNIARCIYKEFIDFRYWYGRKH